MLISLTGVLEDGTPRGSDVPPSAAQTIAFPQGSDVTLRVSVVNAAGIPVDLSASGTSLTFSVKKVTWPFEVVPRVTKVAAFTNARWGVAEFTIRPGDMWYLKPGDWLYDIWLTLDGARNAVVPTSRLVLQASVAPVPHGPPPHEDVVGGNKLAARCLTTNQVGDCVCIRADRDDDGLYRVERADPRVYAKMPAAGVIVSKSAADRCLFQWIGELLGLTGLTPGRVVFLGTDGRLTQDAEAITPDPDGVYVQNMGMALAGDAVLLAPNFALVKRVPD